MSVDLVGRGINLVRHMQHAGDIEKSWKMFDHVNCLCHWTMMVSHVYNNKHIKILQHDVICNQGCLCSNLVLGESSCSHAREWCPQGAL